MHDTVLTADLVEAMNPNAGRSAIAIARQIGELDTVVGEDCLERIGHGRDQNFEEDNRCESIGLLMQLNESVLRCTVYSNEQIEFNHLRPDFGNVDMEEADQIELELFLRFVVALNIRQTAEARTLEAAMQ